MEQALINLAFLLVGAFLGRLSSKGNESITPEIKKVNLNPIQAYKEHKSNKEVEKEQERLKVMLENVDRYDGTGLGQKDIPN